MFTTYTYYKLGSGEITATLSGAIEYQTETPVGRVLGNWDADTYYILDDTPTPRPENPTTLIDLTLENVPVPALITINGTAYETDSDTIELEFDQVGNYKVTVDAFPYLPKEFEIEITTL